MRMDEDDSNATALAVLGHFVLREAILTSTWSLRSGSPDRFCYDRFGVEEERVACHSTRYSKCLMRHGLNN